MGEKTEQKKEGQKKEKELKWEPERTVMVTQKLTEDLKKKKEKEE